MNTTAEKYRDLLVLRIAQIYDTHPGYVGDAGQHACWEFVMRSEEMGRNPVEDCKKYIEWLRYAQKHNKDQYPPKSAVSACVDIGTHYPRAAGWAARKKVETGLLQPKPNPHLTSTVPVQWQPTPEELAEFYADLHRAVDGELDEADREKWAERAARYARGALEIHRPDAPAPAPAPARFETPEQLVAAAQSVFGEMEVEKPRRRSEAGSHSLLDHFEGVFFKHHPGGGSPYGDENDY